MLRQPFSFQTKLMLAVMLAVTLVTVAVVSVTVEKIRSTVIHAAEGSFAEQVESIIAMRRTRLEGSARYLERIADLPAVQRAFENGEFDQSALTNVRHQISDVSSEFDGGPLKNEQTRLTCIVGPKGKLFTISGGEIRNREGRERGLQQFSDEVTIKSMQYGLLVVQMDDGDHFPIEVVASPIVVDGRVAGALLTGQIPYESREDDRTARFPRFNPNLGIDGLISCLLADGELFFSAKDRPQDSAGILAAIERVIEARDVPERVVLGGERHRIFIGELTSEGATLPPSYLVVFYPVENLLSDLRDLRYLGGAIGCAAIAFGMLLAWLISRNLARPIIELEQGTAEIGRGNFAARVTPRGNDEISSLARSFNEMAEGLTMRERLRAVLGKVSDATVAQAMVEGSLELGGEIRKVSVLFCDIRGFTAMIEMLPPADVIDLVNDHMTAMTEVVHKHKGVVDKFVGDEIMVIFGAPKSYDNDTENAVNCACEMLERRDEMNRKLERPIGIGIGVATGEVVVGCMGSVDRLNYTVLGERVNRASRLCSVAKSGVALVDEATAAGLGQERYQEQPAVKLKGYSAVVAVYRLLTPHEADAPPAETVVHR